MTCNANEMSQWSFRIMTKDGAKGTTDISHTQVDFLPPSCLKSHSVQLCSHADDPAGGLSLLGSDRLSSPPPCTTSLLPGVAAGQGGGGRPIRRPLRGKREWHIMSVWVWAKTRQKQTGSERALRQTDVFHTLRNTSEQRYVRVGLPNKAKSFLCPTYPQGAIMGEFIKASPGKE